MQDDSRVLGPQSAPVQRSAPASSGSGLDNAGNADKFQIAPPTVSMPKGGGAIRGIGEKFSANPVTGTGSMSVPIATSPGRSGFGPQLSLSYDSGAGNGPFGFGWNLSLPAITRKTDKGLPRYDDVAESDVFLLSGAEDLVPVFRQDPDGSWVADHPGHVRDAQAFVVDTDGRRVVHEDDVDGYRVRRYRPRIEGLFARIERWTRVAAPRAGEPGGVHWRSLSKDNLLTLYGVDTDSRIADPLADAGRTFSWLISETRDDKGNAVLYRYQPEDGIGVDLAAAHQRNRGAGDDPRRTANRYLKRVHYGNRRPLLDESGQRPRFMSATQVEAADWMFEVVLDYGDHDLAQPTPVADRPWPARADAYSSYRAGFEVRTARLCHRVLMFHHFAGEPDVGRGCLVRSTDFGYSPDPSASDIDAAVYRFLMSATQTGYRRRADLSYDPPSSLPPVEFSYTLPRVRDAVEDIPPESVRNLPVGLDGSAYRWTDLHGEGIPGILTEQAGVWLYKRNLSPIAPLDADGQRPRAWFAPMETVALRPAAALADAEFMDLAGDGQPDLVVMEGPSPGLYEHDDAEGWQRFRPFTSRLNRDFRDPNLKLVDLDGDGHADVLITEHDALVWHASLAEAGFGPARRVAKALDEEEGPRVVFADGTQTIHLADLSGDGLADIVRIRNGDVCYWPNLGHGRFGAKVTMDGAPCFDYPDQFDPARIRLTDIDGSGTTDLIYLHAQGVRLYFNRSGNGWSPARQLSALPRTDDLASVIPVDLLGNGTACLVWSSPLPGAAQRPMRYVSLMGDEKPHLLVRAVNNLGAETRVRYAPSTKFYLSDKLAGRPWMTRLPFPVHVVERVETYDHISRSRFVTRYEYHHGAFDGEEREFRGFGMVEQFDSEEFDVLSGPGAAGAPAANLASEWRVPLVRTRTWFHTGFYLGREHVSDYYAGLLDAADRGEYFREPGLADDEARALLLLDTVLPAGLTLDEQREACRALKGAMLRQEVYADDAPDGATSAQVERARTPYSVTEQTFTIRALQPCGANRHAVFFTHPCEALSWHYERNPADPRLQHALTLEVDAYGNVLKQAAIGYGRREQVRVVDANGGVLLEPNPGLAGLDPRDRAAQTTAKLTCAENRVTNSVESTDALRTPLPCEAITFELTGHTPTGPAGRYQASDFVEADPAAPGRLRHRAGELEIPYEASPTAAPSRRRIEWLRTLYRSDDLADRAPDLDLRGLLPLGELQSLGLLGESYKLAYTPGLLDQVFRRPRPAPEPAEDLLPDREAVLGAQGGEGGGYLRSQALVADGRFPAGDRDDHWWMPSGRAFHSLDPADDAATERAQARQHFHLPRRYRDPFGHDAFVTFDAHDLAIVETHDALDNRSTVDVHDYRVLQPRLVSDPNGSQTEVAFDILGLVVGTAVMGRTDQNPRPGDTLAGFVADVAPDLLERFFAAPRQPSSDPARSEATAVVHELLQGATTRIVYDLDRFRRLGEPPFAATIARETHVSDLPSGTQSRLQVGFSYSDGFGREVQKKIQAEPRRQNPDDPRVLPVNPRWVGSGWMVFNNKGKPVRQFEPFFTSTHGFEFGREVGVSPVLFYDPTGRVIATLHPNHTYEKAVFDPWRQTTFDVNDTCAARNAQTGDPRTDPDIAFIVAAYFAGLPADPVHPWQTWHALRIGGALGDDERIAAERAQAHADTPTTAHVDALGRPFLTVVRNRVSCAGHPLDGQEDDVATRVDLDIEGNLRVVRDAIAQAGDALGRIVMRYDYDLLGRRIHQLSMEAGGRWMLDDAAGQAIRTWNSRGHTFATRHDALRRPVSQTVRGHSDDPDPRLRERDMVIDLIEYGEDVPDPGGRLNLRTRAYRHFDSAGLAVSARLSGSAPIEAYDFKGNLLRSTRRLARAYDAAPDWSQPDEPQLEAEFFEAATRYDALNRPVQSVAPHSDLLRSKRHVVQAVFSEANLLARVHVWLERAQEPDALLDPEMDAPSPLVGVVDIDHDAKGQRLRIVYKNGARTTYDYDEDTFRLTRLLTRRPAAAFPGDDPQPPLTNSPGRQVQSLHYTYDPAGNITHIHDDAQRQIFFANAVVGPSNDYTYDALYRLIQATGREHLGSNRQPLPHSHDDAGRVGQPHPNSGELMARYREQYVYDAVGNFVSMIHRRASPDAPGWTREYEYLEDSLTEDGSDGTPRKTSNRLSRTTINLDGNDPIVEPYRHDAHGNMVRMPHLGVGSDEANMAWDCRDRLVRTGLGGGGTAHYTYDASGQRVRKVWLKSTGLIEERIYLGVFEVFRRHEGSPTDPISADTATLERETLHVMDDKQRIALVETRTLDTRGRDEAPRQLVRYQFGNHLGSGSLELNDLAQIISYEEYAPYGSSTYQAVRTEKETAKRYRYTGKERDEESGLYYHGARYCAPCLGQWISTDPKDLVDGPGLYRYSLSNPVRFSDPSGTKTIEQKIESIESPIGWFFARTGYDIWNVASLGALSRVEQQEDLGTAEGVAASTFTAARMISNTASFGLQENIYETQMKEGPGLNSIAKGVAKTGEQLLPVDEAKVILDPTTTGAEKAAAGSMAVSKIASLVALGAGVSGKNPVLSGPKGKVGIGYAPSGGPSRIGSPKQMASDVLEGAGHTGTTTGAETFSDKVVGSGGNGKVRVMPERPKTFTPDRPFEYAEVEVPLSAEEAAAKVAQSAKGPQNYNVVADNCSMFTGDVLEAAGIQTVTVLPKLQWLNFKYLPHLGGALVNTAPVVGAVSAEKRNR